MQQQFQCPRCKSPISYGAPSCNNCGQTFIWQHQPQPPPQQPVQTPPYRQQYQQPQQPGSWSDYQQQAPPAYRHVISICIKCKFQNYHGVDNNGEATVTCQSCSTVYNVKTYEVRTIHGRRDRKSGIKSYKVRVKEPDRDERLLEFDSTQDIEMRAGDWIIGSYSKGKLKYLFNEKIRHYWDVQSGTGCVTIGLILVASIATVIVSFVYWF